MSKVLLIILDGWGEGRKDYSNPIYLAKEKDFWEFIREHFPFYLLQASGIAVGLPWKEEGNSEVGHLCMGIGKVYYQNYPRITLAIKDGSFFENEVLISCLNHAKKYNSRVHLVGLLTEGIIHSAYEHLRALLEFFKRNNFQRVYLHLFLDGKDSPPQSGLSLLEKLEKDINYLGVGKIATLCGRTYGMDRNEYWKIKTQVAFYLITEGVGKEVEDYKSYIKEIYEKNPDFIDENLEPILIDKNGIVKDNDVVFFFNFRPDGMYQLAKAFLEVEFPYFKRTSKNNLFIASMTKYLEDIDYPVAFPPIKIYTSVSKIISENNLLQLKIAEKYKAYHLTYFFNGFVNEPHPGEYIKILPPSEKSFKENPLLQSKLITELIINAVKENIYAFIAANYSAPDIIGHTGNINLAIQVVEGLNYEMKRIYNEIIDKEEWFMIITSDHGNIESMINLKTGEAQTTHDVNPVPCYIINKNFYIEKKSYERIIEEEKIRGSLIDIGPTILKLLNLEIPTDWEGRPLI